MEAVKNRLTRLGRNAGTFVVDADSDLVSNARHCDLHEAAGRRKAHRIVDDRVDRSCKPVRLAHDDCRVLARPSKGEASVARFAPAFPAMHELLDKRPEI